MITYSYKLPIKIKITQNNRSKVLTKYGKQQAAETVNKLNWKRKQEKSNYFLEFVTETV